MKKTLSILILTAALNVMQAQDVTCINGVPSDLTIASILTPNNDGIHDVFSVESKKLKSLHVEIFTRWGQKVYTIDGINGIWDATAYGSVMAPGTYYYVMQFTSTCPSSAPVERAGFFTIIRPD